MQEIELRFHIPPEALPRLRRLVDPRGQTVQTRLAAHYYDDAERRLATAGIGLRLRLEGNQWVQTVKGPAQDGMTRLEHNAALPPGVEPGLDLERHAGHPLGERLKRLGPLNLVPRFRTAILRRHRRQRVAGALLELCLDEGQLLAGVSADLAVHELEVELLQGNPLALLRHAHALVGRWPLSLDLRSKAERGEHLARGLTQSPPRKSRPLVLRPDMRPGEALRALLLNCFDQIGANASQIGAGDSEPEHLHQLRVGLRRLRSGLRLLRGLWPELAHPALPAFEQQAATWFRSMNALRDDDVMDGALSQAWQASRLQAQPGACPPPRAPRSGAKAAAACVRQPNAQQFLIECLGWIERLREDPVLVPQALTEAPSSLASTLARRLRRWHRQVQRECAGFDQLSAPDRHQLRKRIKRLRYGLEFAASLFREGAVTKRVVRLRQAQDLLGELNDLEIALERCHARLDQAPEALFELGWLCARREALLPRCARSMRKLAEGPKLAKLG